MNLLKKYLVDRGIRPSAYFMFGDECPCCGETCCDQSEYVDVGVGNVQVTYDMECWNCYARGTNSGTNVKWYVPDESSPDGYALFEEDNDEANRRVSGSDVREEAAAPEEVASEIPW